MIVKAVRVINFRSIRDESLPCKNLTTLVGPNGSGKSTFLRALALFYESSPRITDEDFYARDIGEDIEIEVTFTNLSEKEKDRFRNYIRGENLTVVRIFSERIATQSGKYYGSRLQNPDFNEIRQLSGRELISRYGTLRETDDFTELPAARSQVAVLDALENWEAENPDRLKPMRDQGQFFGFTNVARGYLGDVTKFILVPAVRDASEDAVEGKNSAISALMDLLVRKVFSERKDISDFKDQIQKQYSALSDPTKIPELGSLASALTETLQIFYKDTSVALGWEEIGQIVLPTPKTNTKIVEDGFSISVGHAGHGVQRAFILTILQHLAVAEGAQSAAVEEESESASQFVSGKPQLDLILAIEEPELFQHPNQQRHFSRVLFDLASGGIPGVANQTQVLYATHSPLFVGIDRFDQVRRVHKISADNGKPKTTRIVYSTWNDVADRIWIADGKTGDKYTESSLKPRVATIMTPFVNEGFFSAVVVLVEGENDRAAVLGMAKFMGINLEREGISVIPCDSKNNLDRPLAIFRGLEIPTYVIWDSDRDKGEQKETNHRLLRLVDASIEDWPSRVEDTYACFENNLETNLEEEIGKAKYEEFLREQQSVFGISEKARAIKNPNVIENILGAANKEKIDVPTLRSIVEKIRKINL